MKRPFRPLAGILALAALAGLSWAGIGGDARAQSAPAAFAEAHVQLEQNATDGDVEVVFEVKGGEEGLTRLTITAPNGRNVVDYSAPDASKLGIRQFRFESPEPKDAASLKAEYPEGVYTFSGTTASGAKLEGKATLGHELPATTSFVRPRADAEGVAVKGLVMSWTPVKNVAACNVYIEQDELGVSINARLPGTATSFVVPDGFLAPGTEYVMGIGTVTRDGNSSYIEGTFTTAARR